MNLVAAIAENPWEAIAISAIAIAAAVVVHGRAVKATLGRLEVSVQAIDAAVNHRLPGDTTMSQDVAEVRAQVATLVAGMAEVRGRLEDGDGQFDQLEAGLSQVAGEVRTMREQIGLPAPG